MTFMYMSPIYMFYVQYLHARSYHSHIYTSIYTGATAEAKEVSARARIASYKEKEVQWSKEEDYA